MKWDPNGGKVVFTQPTRDQIPPRHGRGMKSHQDMARCDKAQRVGAPSIGYRPLSVGLYQRLLSHKFLVYLGPESRGISWFAGCRFIPKGL